MIASVSNRPETAIKPAYQVLRFNEKAWMLEAFSPFHLGGSLSVSLSR